VLLISRQGKTRLTKWYTPYASKARLDTCIIHCTPDLSGGFDSMSALFSGFVWVQLQEKSRIVRELTSTVLSRPPKACNFIEWKDQKVVYKRYASLYFVAGIDASDNELIVLEQIHLFVEVLDRYFGNVRN